MPDTEPVATPSAAAAAAPQARSAAAPPPPRTVHIDRAEFSDLGGSTFTLDGDTLYGVKRKDGEAL